jgi:ribonucleotide monophosphatase NagD (HAD superfamily)
VGKPAAAMFDSALRLLGAAGPETVVIGDSLRTDIAGGRAIGATTVLITNGPDRSGGTPEEQPDVTVAGLAPLARLLEAGEL